MHARSVTLLALTFALCLSAFSIRGAEKLSDQVAAATLVKQGETAPDFTAQTTDGRELHLSNMQGKVVLLYFFSVQSVPSTAVEMRYLEKELYQHLKGRADFMLVAIGRGHTRDDLVKIGGENRLTFPLVADPDSAIYQRYFSKFVPRKVVVKKNGTIADLISGNHELDGVFKLQRILEREFATKP